MKRNFFLVLVFVALLSCRNSKPTTADLVGTWVNNDGAIIELQKAGIFTAKFLPGRYFRARSLGVEDDKTRINGSGNWRVSDGQSFKEVKLDFKKMNDTTMNGYYSVMIDGTGFTGSNPPWHLFVWQKEAGGERYKFTKR